MRTRRVILRLVATLLALCVAGAGACADGGGDEPDGGAVDAAVPTDTGGDTAVDGADRAATDASGDTGGDTGPPPTVRASGHAFGFGPAGGRVAGATVTVLEHPELGAATTDEVGAFAFEGLPAGGAATFYLEGEGRPPIQTATFTLGDEDLERVAIQTPDDTVFDALVFMLQEEPAPDRCQIAATVTRRGNDLYDTDPGSHGEPGATVTIEPAVPGERGPIYFEMIRYDQIVPLRSLSETSHDGGLLFVNVAPGRYVLRAHKEGVVFRDVTVDCRPGVITNAAPPWGLQALEGGVGPREPGAEW